MSGPDRGKQLFVTDLREGTAVDDIFAVGQVTLLETKAGKPYLALTLVDRSGGIEARAWNDAARFAGFAVSGAFVRVQGLAKSFQGQLQVTINAMEAVAAERVALAAFMPVSPRDRAVMEAELDGLISSLADPCLRELLGVIFSGETRELFCRAPAAKKMHHAYLHGLLEHSLAVAALAELTAARYSTLDRDLLLAGALLHDLAKIREFSFETPSFDYTTTGRLIGHLVLGCDMIRAAAAALSAALPPARLDQLLHLILSHHGQHDFGAPVLPMTREALILHHLDDMDAKMQYCDHLAEKLTEPGWTDYQRPLERYLYLRPGDNPIAESAPTETSKASSGPVRGENASAILGQPSGRVVQSRLF